MIQKLLLIWQRKLQVMKQLQQLEIVIQLLVGIVCNAIARKTGTPIQELFKL